MDTQICPTVHFKGSGNPFFHNIRYQFLLDPTQNFLDVFKHSHVMMKFQLDLTKMGATLQLVHHSNPYPNPTVTYHSVKVESARLVSQIGQVNDSKL